MSLDFKRVLVLAPHTDDGELGCGGTMARFLEEGCEVYYAAFSTCEQSVPTGMEKNILKKELCNAMQTLGIEKENIKVYNYPVRNFLNYRQEILDELISLGESIKPDMVLAPSIHDVHQDHRVVAEEAMRAFKKVTLVAYEVPWNNFTFNNQMYVVLEDRHVEKKVSAIACYESQKGRMYTEEEFTKGQAKVHGVQVGKKYAEVFEAVRWIV